ncbi:hypothetical protein SAMN05216428_11290 [Nitrosospira sp. Nsp11]|uniref:hypothetical protein n=1 Tax=Nitrosospira sp. Nsp11 TaxID=1855338 RepID=UPI00091B2EC6|nr:hypothetical protein [Nitrosospira sp. Nsp11]SHM05489.1 hypothetical protein SAMN05216428_11290 [Nitrosospira sp. Nsp11]
MRDYGKIQTSFWASEDIKKLSDDGRMLALYLLSSPHTTQIGCFRLPDGYVCDDLSWTQGRVSKGFKDLCDKGFATRDEASKWVVIHHFTKWNEIENPNQAKAAIKLFEQVPDSSLVKPMLARSLREFSPRFPVEILNSFEGVSKGLHKPFLNQEQEQEKEQEQNIKPLSPVPSDRPECQEVFDHWRKEMNHEKAILDPKRLKLIKQALAMGYTVDDLRAAIDGCKLSPYHQGQNDSKSKYDGLDLILRDAGKIDKFMAISREATVSPKREFVHA